MIYLIHFVNYRTVWSLRFVASIRTRSVLFPLINAYEYTCLIFCTLFIVLSRKSCSKQISYQLLKDHKLDLGGKVTLLERIRYRVFTAQRVRVVISRNRDVEMEILIKRSRSCDWRLWIRMLTVSQAVKFLREKVTKCKKWRKSFEVNLTRESKIG